MVWKTPCRKFSKFRLFREDQKVLTRLYNFVVFEKIYSEAQINKQYICANNSIAFEFENFQSTKGWMPLILSRICAFWKSLENESHR